MSISRNWPQLCLDNISDKEKISKGLFPHQTSHQYLEMRRHLMVIKKLQRFVSSSNFLPALGGKMPFDGSKKLERFVSSSNFSSVLGDEMPFDGSKETSRVCFLIKLLTST